MPLSWIGAATSVALAVVAMIAERRRRLREDLDRVGVVDWRDVQLFALFATMICVGLAFSA